MKLQAASWLWFKNMRLQTGFPIFFWMKDAPCVMFINPSILWMPFFAQTYQIERKSFEEWKSISIRLIPYDCIVSSFFTNNTSFGEFTFQQYFPSSAMFTLFSITILLFCYQQRHWISSHYCFLDFFKFLLPANEPIFYNNSRKWITLWSMNY